MSSVPVPASPTPRRARIYVEKYGQTCKLLAIRVGRNPAGQQAAAGTVKDMMTRYGRWKCAEKKERVEEHTL
jgi:hypothetical protein